MNREELKKSIGEDLCQFCPWTNGEIEKPAYGPCEAVIAMKHWITSWKKTNSISMIWRNKYANINNRKRSQCNRFRIRTD